MSKRSIARLQAECSVCESRSWLPVVLVSFWVQSSGYKTRYRLCWECGYRMLRQMTTWQNERQA